MEGQEEAEKCHFFAFFGRSAKFPLWRGESSTPSSDLCLLRPQIFPRRCQHLHPRCSTRLRLNDIKMHGHEIRKQRECKDYKYKMTLS